MSNPVRIEDRDDFETQVADVLMDIVLPNQIEATREEVEALAEEVVILFINKDLITFRGKL